MNILHLTSLLPTPLSSRPFVNDIMLRIAKEYEKKYPGSQNHFIFNVPYSNSFFAFFKQKWKEYHEIIKNGFFEIDGYQVKVIGIPGFGKDIQLRKLLALAGYRLFQRRIENAIQLIKPDIIHAHDMRSNIEIAELIKRKFGINYIVSARNVDLRILNRISKGELNPLAILAHSQMSATRCDGLNVSVHLIPHPVDNSFFKSKQKISTNDSQQLKIIAVSNLIKRKNIDKIISVLNEIDVDCQLLIFGDGIEKGNLEKLVNDYGLEKKIFFKGYRPYNELFEVYVFNDLFILPSRDETLGRVYFEAMASGVPVVASRNTGIDGMIKHQVHGYLVDHNNLNEIKEAILHFANLSTDEKMIMKRNAAAFASKYNWDAILERYYKVYNDPFQVKNKK